MNHFIFTYWHQGFDAAPEIVRACARTFAAYHDNWDIHFLDSEKVQEWLEPIPIPAEKWQKLQLAHRSDIIRTQLLIKYGGVWADPTVWFCKPLDEWLPKVMDAGVFMFQRPGRDRAISNWFIAAEPNNPLLTRLYEALCKYWRENNFQNLDRPTSSGARLLHKLLNRNLELPRIWLKKPVIRLFKVYPYMVYHYMFYDLIRRDRECEAVWSEMPTLSADLPHLLLRKGLFQPLDEAAKYAINEAQSPLYKLTWKLRNGDAPHDSILAYLLMLDSHREILPGVSSS